MSSRFNQRARLARRGMRGRGGVLRAPSAKQGSTSSSFASTQRDKGRERERESEKERERERDRMDRGGGLVVSIGVVSLGYANADAEWS